MPACYKARIAEAVHQAVCEVTGSDGFSHCALYASAGAMVASLATGNEYVVNACRLEVGTGTRDAVDGGAELYLGMDPALIGLLRPGVSRVVHPPTGRGSHGRAV